MRHDGVFPLLINNTDGRRPDSAKGSATRSGQRKLDYSTVPHGSLPSPSSDVAEPHHQTCTESFAPVAEQLRVADAVGITGHDVADPRLHPQRMVSLLLRSILREMLIVLGMEDSREPAHVHAPLPEHRIRIRTWEARKMDEQKTGADELACLLPRGRRARRTLRR